MAQGRTLCLLAIVAAAAIPAQGRIVNLSCRAVADSGEGAIIAGIVIEGAGTKRVLFRAAGPALAPFLGSGWLAETRLELRRAQDGALLAANTGWDTAANAAEVEAAAQGAGAFPFAPGSLDSALLVDLPPGFYTALATPARPGVAPGIALVEAYDGQPGNGARLTNLSARARAGTGNGILIGGIHVAVGDNRVMARAVGPTLSFFGVGDALADPVLEVFSGPSSLFRNESWRRSWETFELASRAAALGAFPLDAGGLEAAAFFRPVPGGYTIQIRGEDGGAGVALFEVYDVHGATRLPPVLAFDLVGFARLDALGLPALTGGGAATVPYDPVAGSGNYWVVDDDAVAAPGFGADFRAALASDAPLVVEINTEIDLSVHGTPDTGANRSAIAHPDLFAPGETTGRVGILELGSNKTLYSALGNGVLKRGQLRIIGKNNIMIRNLEFRELWEWDDATLGAYDRNDWDFINITSVPDGLGNILSRAHHVWIDHCDFANSYDGQIDVIRGTDLVTISWCRFGGAFSDDTTGWVERQIAYLEGNKARFPFYALARAAFPPEFILANARPERKSSLVGNATSALNEMEDSGHLNVTYHHNWYHGVDARMPRLRYGNAHVFNLVADDTPFTGLVAVERAGVAGTSGAAIKVENGYFISVFKPVTSRSSEGDAVLTISGSVNLDPILGLDIGFDPSEFVAPDLFRWNPPDPANGMAPWPSPDNANLPAGYFPAGRTATDYVNDAGYLLGRLQEAGVIVPRDAADTATLRAWLQTTTPSASGP